MTDMYSLATSHSSSWLVKKQFQIREVTELYYCFFLQTLLELDKLETDSNSAVKQL